MSELTWGLFSVVLEEHLSCEEAADLVTRVGFEVGFEDLDGASEGLGLGDEELEELEELGGGS